MSQWTHVCGCIRYEALRLDEPGDITLEDIKKRMGNTVGWDCSKEEFEACNVPCGSEGSIQFMFNENPHKSSIPAFAVGIWGDLRNFGEPDVPKIEEWFKRVLIGEGIWVRSAILEIEVEFTGKAIILMYVDGETDEDNKVVRHDIDGGEV